MCSLDRLGQAGVQEFDFVDAPCLRRDSSSMLHKEHSSGPSTLDSPGQDRECKVTTDCYLLFRRC